jgi:hypothetical protein
LIYFRFSSKYGEEPKFFADYATARLPFVSTEISFPENILSKHKFNPVREKIQSYLDSLEQIDWDDFTKVNSRYFYDIFCASVYLIFENQTKTIITQKQAKCLVDTVKPLGNI